MRLRRVHEDEAGQVVAWTVASMIIVFALMAFAVDIGFFFHARRLAQNAADPAALAGASELPGCGDGQQASPSGMLTSPSAVADYYAKKNYQVGAFATGSPLIQPTPTTHNGYPSMYVRVQRNQRFLLSRFVGLGLSSAVPAEAEAVCGPISQGGICPFFIGAPSPQAAPQYDVNGKLVSAYGLNVGKVYAMKVAAQGQQQGNFNILNLIDNPGADAFRDYLSSGCTDPDKAGNPVVVTECAEASTPECQVETDPGAKSGPTSQALEGGNGANQAGLYEIERTDTTLFPNGHRDCNLTFTLDVTGSFGTVLNSTGAPMTAAQVRSAIDAKTDPRYMSTTQPPCGGIKPDGSIVPQLVHPAVQGRFMQIVMTDGTIQGQSTLDVLGILRMYIVCWSNQTGVTAAQACAQQEPNGQVAIYGTFADFSAPNLLTSGGLGDNPLAPKHVVLVK